MNRTITRVKSRTCSLQGSCNDTWFMLYSKIFQLRPQKIMKINPASASFKNQFQPFAKDWKDVVNSRAGCTLEADLSYLILLCLLKEEMWSLFEVAKYMWYSVHQTPFDLFTSAVSFGTGGQNFDTHSAKKSIFMRLNFFLALSSIGNLLHTLYFWSF